MSLIDRPPPCFVFVLREKRPGKEVPTFRATGVRKGVLGRARGRINISGQKKRAGKAGKNGGEMMAKKSVSTRIKDEKARLLQLFADADENKLDLARGLIERAAYITVNLQDLEVELSEKGWTEEYQNGKDQIGVKRSAAADVHISLTKNLSTIMKQLLDIVPPAKRKNSKLEELAAE